MSARLKTNKKRKIKKKFTILTVIFFILFELVFSAVTAPLIAFYGPFDNVKKTIVGTAMATFTHRYIAKIFLTDAEINKILNSNGSTSDNEKQDLNEVQAKHINDSKIVVHKIQTKKFDGYVMEISDSYQSKGCHDKKAWKGRTKDKHYCKRA